MIFVSMTYNIITILHDSVGSPRRGPAVSEARANEITSTQTVTPKWLSWMADTLAAPSVTGYYLADLDNPWSPNTIDARRNHRSLEVGQSFD